MFEYIENCFKNLFISHASNEPFFVSGLSPVLFYVSRRIPLVALRSQRVAILSSRLLLLSRGLKAASLAPHFLLLFGSFLSRQAFICLVRCAYMIPVVSSVLLVLGGCTANVISLENTLALRVLPSFIASVPASHACARRHSDASTRLHS
jgi:hypothetical protein